MTQNDPQRGKFPFASSSTDQESKYLTWLRNHSNYLAVGGMLNSLGAVAIYVRGVFGNLLILMPILILAGILLGWWHSDLYTAPFAFTKWFMLYGFVALVLSFGYEIGSRYAESKLTFGWQRRVFDILAFLAAIAAAICVLKFTDASWWQAFWVFVAVVTLYIGYTVHRNHSVSSHTAFSDDSRKKLGQSVSTLLNNFTWFVRKFREHYSAWILASISICLLIELSPHIIEAFRANSFAGEFGIKECLAAVVATITTLGSLLKFLPRSSQLVQKALVLLAAIVSLGLVWGITLRIANFFFYGVPIFDWRIWIPYFCVGTTLAAFLISICRSNSLSRMSRIQQTIVGLSIGAIAFAFAAVMVVLIKHESVQAKDSLGTLTRPLARLVDGLTPSVRNSESDLSNPLLSELVDRKTKLDGEASVAMAEEQLSKLTSFTENDLASYMSNLRKKYLKDNSYWATFVDTFRPLEISSEEARYFQRASLFLERAETIAEMEKLEKGILFNVLTESGIDNLQTLAERLTDKPIELEHAAIQRVLVQKLPEWLFFDPETWKDTERFKAWISDTAIFKEELDSELAEIFLPMSLASSYLERIPNRIEEVEIYRNRSAPDVAASGPRLISQKAIVATMFQSQIECAKLKILLSNLLPNEADSALKKLPDEWFTSRNMHRLDFDAYTNLKVQGRAATIDEVVIHLVQFEQDFDAKGILSRCGISQKGSQDRDNEGPQPAIAKLPGISFDGGWSSEPSGRVLAACRRMLIEAALEPADKDELIEQDDAARFLTDRGKARFVLSELFDPWVPAEHALDEETAEQKTNLADRIYARHAGRGFSKSDIVELIAARFIFTPENDGRLAAEVIRRVAHGRYGNLTGVESVSVERFKMAWLGKLIILATLLFAIWLFCRWFVNPNATAVHGFYRDKLSTAFILKQDKKGHVVPEKNVRLSDLSRYARNEGESTAPYHLINTAINLQGSDDLNVRDRNSDFFVFSNLFVGGESTGYISTRHFEQAAPDVTAGSAMAISAAAAAPNMGQYTMSLLAFLLTMVNVRLGYWIPNPRFLADQIKKVSRETVSPVAESGADSPDESNGGPKEEACYFDEFASIYKLELEQVHLRRSNVSKDLAKQISIPIETLAKLPCGHYRLIGLCLSGGGIRSAAVNLGIMQVLDQLQILPLIDYLSTVSGGGYLGTGVSTFMRSTKEDSLETSARKKPDTALSNSFRPPARMLLREMTSLLNHESKWVNVSDGGHIENLGAIELLRRRCQIIIVGEGEADPKGTFPGLSTMMRLASIDLGIEINFPTGSLERLVIPESPSRESPEQRIEIQQHFAVAEIEYPKTTHHDAEKGHLIYLRSSIRGNEDQIIKSYQAKHPAFPHESTGDQMFNEGQFEAYRRLGEKMMTEAAGKFREIHQEFNSLTLKSFKPRGGGPN